MAAPEPEVVERLVRAVLDSPRYQGIAPDFVRRIAGQEAARHKDWKEALKATRSKLHQVGGAYLERTPDFAAWTEQVAALPDQPDRPDLRAVCRKMMAAHASTRERLPILDEFYAVILDSIGPVHSVLDLACGLNPLAAPWMPLAPGAEYVACDIYPQMVAFNQAFLTHLGYRAQGRVCDLTGPVDLPEVELALILKTLPCLEQVEKGIPLRLLAAVKARWALVSFPARSLGGHNKGMTVHYGGAFRALLAEQGWAYQAFEFPSELAFLVEMEARS